ncbi:HD domain-containing protein [bacterium]|nr:HD domain-containing protein [bacterium]
MKRKEILLQIIKDLKKITVMENSPEVLSRLILDKLVSYLGCEVGDILLFNNDLGLLFFQNSIGRDIEVNLADSKNTLPNEALRLGEVKMVADISKTEYSSLSRKAVSQMAVPIILGGKVYGVLNFESYKPDFFNDNHLEAVEILGLSLGFILEKAELREEIFNLHQGLLKLLVKVPEKVEPNYPEHAQRVAKLARMIAENMGLNPDEIADAEEAGLLHDIGKTQIDGVILSKPGKLSAQEFEEVKRHTVLGRLILKPIGFMGSILEAIEHHHERFDGAGYPHGLKGEEIPLLARVLAVAEAYDGMVTVKSYAEPLTSEEALNEIKIGRGTAFDPQVVDAFLGAISEEIEESVES